MRRSLFFSSSLRKHQQVRWMNPCHIERSITVLFLSTKSVICHEGKGMKGKARTTRILLIRDEMFLSRINKKTSPNKIYDDFWYHHGLSVMDWPPWRFVRNHHGLTETVAILNRHGRARGLVSPAQVHFLWRKINVTDELPRHYEGLHGCLRG
jgi:hypothetical protein